MFSPSCTPPTIASNFSLRQLDEWSNIVLLASRSCITTRRLKLIWCGCKWSHTLIPFSFHSLQLENKKATVVDLSFSLVSPSQNLSGEHKKGQLGIMTRRRQISIQVKSVKSRFGAKTAVVAKSQKQFDWESILEPWGGEVSYSLERKIACVLHSTVMKKKFRSTRYQNILVGGSKKPLEFKMKWTTKACSRA